MSGEFPSGQMAGSGGGRPSPEEIYARLFGHAGTTAGEGAELGQRQILAIIWATVDRDRVLADLGLVAERLADDPLLGASVTLIRPVGDHPIAILEPITEGRLAASLARHGEGPAGEYVQAPLPFDAMAAVGRAAGSPAMGVSRPADGPFGRSVVILADDVAGPHLVLVERPAGTIGR